MTGAAEPRRPAAVIALGASAGGVEALQSVVARIPRSVNAAILVVLHLPPTGFSALPAVLARAGPLQAHHAVDDEPLTAGEIFVAPPGFHLEVADGRAKLSSRAPEHGHRPSIDVLFRSVAHQWGGAGAGIVLSGFLDDGAAGLAAIKQMGGFAAVQEPSDAAFPEMPIAAIRDGHPDVVCRAEEMYASLEPWLKEIALHPPGVRDAAGSDPRHGGESNRVVTPFTCPECGGALWVATGLGEGAYRCRFGHAYSQRDLVVGKQATIEKALSAAIVALDELHDLHQRIGEDLERTGQQQRAASYRSALEETRRRAELLRQMLDDLVRSVAMSEGIGDGDTTG